MTDGDEALLIGVRVSELSPEWIEENSLGFPKVHAVLSDIGFFLSVIPVKDHESTITQMYVQLQ